VRVKLIGTHEFARLEQFDTHRGITVIGFYPDKVKLRSGTESKLYKQGEGKDNWQVSYIDNHYFWVEISWNNENT